MFNYLSQLFAPEVKPNLVKKILIPVKFNKKMGRKFTEVIPVNNDETTVKVNKNDDLAVGDFIIKNNDILPYPECVIYVDADCVITADIGKADRPDKFINKTPHHKNSEYSSWTKKSQAFVEALYGKDFKTAYIPTKRK